MKKCKIFFIFVSIMLFSTITWAGTVYILNSNIETLSKYDTESGEVVNNILQVGLYANQLIIHNERAYVVNSGEHNVQVIDLSNESTLGNILLPNGSNPYWMALMPDGTKGYITGLMTDKVYVIDTQSFEVINTIDVGMAPEGLCLVGEILFVMNTRYNWMDPYSTTSTITAIDVEDDQDITTIPLNYYNAQYCDVDAMGRLHVVCTGAYDNTGVVYLVDTQDFTICDSVMIGGSPTKINIHDNGIAYLTDAFGQGCMAYDTYSLEIIHSSADLFATGGTFIQFDINGNLYIGDALDWVNNGKVHIYTPDEQLITTFTVGVNPIDAAFYGFEPGIQGEEAEILQMSLRNFPNPFSTSTTISFNIPTACPPSGGNLDEEARIKIYNIKGQLIRELGFSPPAGGSDLGFGEAFWDGKNNSGKPVPSGVYLYRLITDSFTSDTKKMILIR